MLKKSTQEWSKDRCSRTAGALAFFTVLSLSPLLLLSVSVAGVVFSNADAKAELLTRIAAEIGEADAEAIRPVLDHGADANKGWLGSIISLIILVIGASGLFSQVQQALNDIWRVPDPEEKSLLGALLAKLSSVAIALVAATALVASMSLSVVVSMLHKSLPLAPILFRFMDAALSLLFMTLVLAMVFKKVPVIDIAWSDVWWPALFTSLLFVLGKVALGIYFEFSTTGSAYGAAGSLFILLLWLFYIWQIILFGTEFCYVYAHGRGSLKNQR